MVPPHEINYVRITVESYDGMAVVRTLDPKVAALELLVAPGCDAMIDGLLESLSKEGVPLEKISTRGKSERFLINTMGCQMNVYDSDYLAQALIKRGLRQTQDPKHADIIIINTCTVREKPDQKAYTLIGRISKLKKNKKDMILGVIGCLAQKAGDYILERYPEVDFVAGPREVGKVPDIIWQIRATQNRVMARDLDIPPPPFQICDDYFRGRVSAFVSIMQGCNNFCSYCIVPYVRGREISRSPGEILEEIRGLLGQGIKEITLLGQNVNSYNWEQGKEKWDFPRLLRTIGALPGLLRLRFTTSHPKDLSDELISCFEDMDVLCSHIHLPFQAGSNKILKRMRRNYTREHYMELVNKLRRARPDIAITSDVMVGFPGETREDFAQTMDLIEKVRFDGLYSFKYSDRKGTAAETFSEKVHEQEKAYRLEALQKTQKQITLAKNKALEGNVLEVLVEGAGKKRGQLSGRTSSNKIVNFNCDKNILGQLVNVLIKLSYANSLYGELMS